MKIFNEYGEEITKRDGKMEFHLVLVPSAACPGFELPIAKPHQCEEIRLIRKGKNSVANDIILGKVEGENYIYLGKWNDGIL